MRNKFAGLVLAVLATLAPLAVATPANAAYINCVTATPWRRADRSFDIGVSRTTHPYYTGKPFSQKLYVEWWEGPEWARVRKTYVYTIIPIPRWYHTGPLKKYTTLYRAEAWQSGTKCATWTGRIYVGSR